MRAFDGGFHDNLKQMYDYLGIGYISPKFIYLLSTLSTAEGKQSPYFVHSSSNHQIPPIRPDGYGYVKWVVRITYLAICYFWFTTCCFLIKPKPATAVDEDETLRHYLKRIRLPWHFTKHYFLPLMSSVTTCSHDALLNFPALDAIEYAKRTYRKPHYTVIGGVQTVQTKISKGLAVEFGANVTAVENIGTKVRVSWTDSNSKTYSTDFDHAIMAVTPNVVGTIYEPLQKAMGLIPVVCGESVVHHDASTIPDCGQLLNRFSVQTNKPRDRPQVMYICSDPSSTESIHEYPPSVIVTNFPISRIDPTKVLHRARLTRVLRTPKSRKVVNQIFMVGGKECKSQEEPLWRNGTGNVWLVGAWCWDGMVLLEGCVVSAMRVATSLGVEVPWVAVN